jgi:hypothetical protein
LKKKKITKNVLNSKFLKMEILLKTKNFFVFWNFLNLFHKKFIHRGLKIFFWNKEKNFIFSYIYKIYFMFFFILAFEKKIFKNFFKIQIKV